MNHEKVKSRVLCVCQVHEFLRDQEIGTSTMCTLSNYWSLIKQRANGKLKTNARFMRDFVTAHPEYKQDSVVSERISYDLLCEVERMQDSEPTDHYLLAGLHLKAGSKDS